MKCYCQCRLMPDKRSPLGWAVQVFEIQTISWKTIVAIMDHLGRNDLDDPAIFSSA